MSQSHSGMADSADSDQPLAHRALNELAQRTIQIRLFKVAASGNVYDANVVLVFVLQNPFKTTSDVFIGYVTGAANFHQHHFRVRRDTAIETVRQMTVAGGYN